MRCISSFHTRTHTRTRAHTHTYTHTPHAISLRIRLLLLLRRKKQIASYDQTGPHLYQTDPSGAYYEYVAQAIGARAQSGKTYLEKYYKEFDNLGVDDLIKHALKALSGTTGACLRACVHG